MEKTNETEISNLPNKEVKELVIKTLIQLENKWAPKCNKELESIKKKNQSNLKSTITEMETHPHTHYKQLAAGDTEECISDLEDRKMEIAQSEQEEKDKLRKRGQFKGLVVQHQEC